MYLLILNLVWPSTSVDLGTRIAIGIAEIALAVLAVFILCKWHQYRSKDPKARPSKWKMGIAAFFGPLVDAVAVIFAIRVMLAIFMLSWESHNS